MQLAVARDIIIIEHIQNNETAQLVKKILMNKFQLPDRLITINLKTETCSIQNEAILHLCVLKNGELEIKKINKYVLKTAFNVFLDENFSKNQKE
jgi:hypothetical protein